MRQFQKLTPEFRLLMENTQEMLIFFDSDFRVIFCNSKVYLELGYSEDEIYLLPLFRIFKTVFNNKNKPYKLTPDFNILSEETNAYRKNQTCFPVDLTINVMKKGNDLIGLCSAVNISEAKEMTREINQLNTELKQYDRLQNDLVANITHELRTPVNGILGFANILMDTELKANQIEAVNIIKRCCNNMNSLINNLLDYAKLSNDKLILEQREFSFRNFIKQIINFNLASINEKGLKLVVDISEDIPDIVNGDEFRLAQVLNNLFSNAVKFTSEGQIGLKVIKIPASKYEIELFFMLFDTGIGISREEKDRLFKSFTQADSSITRMYGGTGLGLSISKMLIEAMQGSIEVDSEKGKGSTFSFSVRLGVQDMNDIDEANGQIENSVTLGERPKSLRDVEDTLVKSAIQLDRLQLQNTDTFFPIDKLNLTPMKKALSIMYDLIEKLVICIEMNSWEKAEELVNKMKQLIPKNHTANEKRLLRLLFAIRKENHDDSLRILKDLEEHMLEEK